MFYSCKYQTDIFFVSVYSVFLFCFNRRYGISYQYEKYKLYKTLIIGITKYKINILTKYDLQVILSLLYFNLFKTKL
jgi:hypothetical protein